ncbi:electron transfer flavoprotein subunit beta/FixA family protein [Corallincola holothuriorum]|uniref:Electron transfer flavoprotein subunit beta n=1 Tax=Corallincola holothuriorum TaxID=2282215 RepID=A0A368NHJ8_9GAMM|nr:electron transfer flavoprotein subunit beta/FixA family protein [Corallincola holothuriorum]RCU49600.1 electron transfer flavoprotein subunit beta/FixA family protein [Corallincola holothuriorum]
MKVLVAIKRVIDPSVKVRVKTDGTGIETAGVKMAVNPFCEIAVEQAVQLKEAGLASEVVTVSIGDGASQEQLRTSLALGADRAVHLQTDSELEPLNVAKLLKGVVDRESPGLVLLGKQSIDGDNNQTGQMLAGLLNWSQGTFASKVEIDGNKVNVTRELDSGLQTLCLTLPAVISTDLRLNTPRFASLPNIMKARQKPLESESVDEHLSAMSQHIEILELKPPAPRKAGVKVSSVDELVDKLRNEAGVI